MRHEKLGRELKLMLFLLKDHNLTISEICTKFELSRRSFYYYMDFFREAGFHVEVERKHFYRIRLDSPWFDKMNASVSDLAFRARLDLSHQSDRNLLAVYEAINNHRQVVLEGYASIHSNTVKDRRVEPYMLMNQYQEIRCYELESGMNKTFKLSRIGNVQILDEPWSHESEHREIHTDAFLFSGDATTTVKLRMGRLAATLLREEHPMAECCITPDGDDHWIASLPVCSYVGIGRFVLGLLDDIEILESEEFRQYLADKVSMMRKKLKS